jgi:phage terminase small subunit
MTDGKQKPLSDKVKTFIDVYDGDIKASATKSNLSHGYCKQLMSLPKHSRVQKAIRDRELTRSNLRIMNREQRQEFWTDVVLGRYKDKLTVEGQTVEVEPDLKDRLKASELLGRSEADFTDKMGVGGIGKNGEVTDAVELRFQSGQDEEE